MGKKNKIDETSQLLSENNLEDKRPKKKSKLPLFLFILCLVSIAVIFSLNLFSLRDRLIRQIPLLNNLVEDTDENQNLSKDELIAKIKVLENDLAKLGEEYTSLEIRFNDRGNEINSLMQYKEGIEQFNSDKAEFDEAVAKNDIQAFAEFYKNMFPENAERLYGEFIVSSQNDKELKKYVNTFSSMDESSAAKILEKMMGSDIELVVKTLKNVDSNIGAGILAQMNTDNAANIARRMAPDTE